MAGKATQNNIPRHIAIIMDGNGRWARRRGLPRVMGHRRGVKTAQKIVQACVELKIEVLTLYTFSSDNWRRPKEEVDFLLNMLKEFLKKEASNISEHNIRFQIIGRINELPASVRKELLNIVDNTKNNSGLILNLALNYGGRVEIVDAVRKIAEAIVRGELLPEDIDEVRFNKYLYMPGLPDPDLLIRTGGEFRVSNFLLWQISYTEVYISTKLWPDFTRRDLELAIGSFKKRERRFGGIPA
jgi:undecaprenyl diphosphate synthase